MKIIKAIISILALFMTGLSVGHAQQNWLADYQTMALDSNPELQIAQKNYEMAVERVLQSGTLPDPTLSVAYGLLPVQTRLGPQQAKISVMQMFPWFGSLDAKGKQAALSAQAEQENYVLAKNKLQADIAYAWYDLFFIHKSIVYIQKQIDIFGMLERLATIKFQSNQSSMVDVLRFQMAQQELAAKILSLQDKERTARIQFNLLLNRDTELVVQIADTLAVPENRLFTLDSILQNNPRIKAVDAAANAADYQIKASKLSGYPTIGVGLDYSFIGNRTDMQVDGSGTDAIMPMLSISIPIYRKKYSAKVQESIIYKEKIEYQRIAMQNMLTADYEKALFNYNDALRNMKLSSDLLSKANQVLDILRTSYTTSGKDYDQLLEIQNTALKYQLNYQEALTSLYKAITYLEFLSS